MTRLFGFTYNWMNRFVVGLGRKCFCFYIYIARVPKRRIKGYCYMTNSENVVFNMKHNIDKFRFFGYMDIDNEDLMDE